MTSCSVYFTWTDEKRYTLAKLVYRLKAYKKTELSMKSKFEIVYKQLKEKPEFEQLNMTSQSLQNSFKRDQEAVLIKLGILKEQVNLSGLPTEPSEYEKLHVAMAEEESDLTKKRKRKQEKAKNSKNLSNVLVHESLIVQGNISSPLPDIETNVHATQSDVSPVSNTSNTSKSSMMSSADLICKMTQEIKAACNADGVLEDDKELERELKRSQIALAKSQDAAAKAQEFYYLSLTNNITSNTTRM